MIDLTNDQQKAIDAILDWYKSDNSQYITLGGYAGTGKTTVISLLRQKLKELKVGKVAFCAYTGKASRVLETKLKENNALLSKDSVSTIHSLIYTALFDDSHQIIGWEKKEKVDADLIVVDEASMIDKNIWEDLTKYGVRIIAVGDHGQLPPINGEFGLMKKPILMLNQIHRQAENSPIIKLSIMAREDGYIPIKKYSPNVRKIDRYNSDAGMDIEDELRSYKPDTLVLCGYNKTRLSLNKTIRSYLGYESFELEAGERVICLKNDSINKLTNGMLGKVIKIKHEGEHHYYTEIEIDGDGEFYKGLILRSQIDSPNPVMSVAGLKPTELGGRFDRGYALTVHKSQGSQANKVVLFEERFPQMTDSEWRKWLYTGITRAEERLTIIGG
jgi:exodeoxyribonuclease V